MIGRSNDGHLHVNEWDMFVRVSTPIKLFKGWRLKTSGTCASHISSKISCGSKTSISSRGNLLLALLDVEDMVLLSLILKMQFVHGRAHLCYCVGISSSSSIILCGRLFSHLNHDWGD